VAAADLVHLGLLNGPAARLDALALAVSRRRPSRDGRAGTRKLQDWLGLAAGSRAGRPFATRRRAAIVMRAG
jgi:hypothetical protein